MQLCTEALAGRASPEEALMAFEAAKEALCLGLGVSDVRFILHIVARAPHGNIAQDG
ncbi:hypothetical protein NKH45_34390 [Mesorhizobium sp. M1156]